ERGIRVKISSFSRIHHGSLLTKAKACGHYINSMLANQEAVQAGYDEALMLDPHGYVAEASTSNLFMLRHGEFVTPPRTAILEGITRDTVMRLSAAAGVPVVLMHAPGEDEDLHAGGHYDDVVLDVFDWLRARRDAALAAGIARDRIVLDPGIGFGKSLAENLALMNALPLFHALGQPLLVGASRKRMIGALSNEAPAEKRLGGSLALALKALDAGVQIVRVHDVAATVQALHVWRGLRDAALTDFGQLPQI
ncbi:MAG: dihydropteroate synthase, partial [Novosphingobium sp.]